MLKRFIAAKTSFELVNDSHIDNDYHKLGPRPPDVAVITVQAAVAPSPTHT